MTSAPLRSTSTDYIAALRFPLAVLVVMIHAFNEPWRDLFNAQADSCGLVSEVAHFVSHIVPTFAVPAFFMIAGYLFFYKVSNLTWDIYRQKLARRFYTLFLPYVVWCLLAFALYAVLDVASGKALRYAFDASIFWNIREIGGVTVGALGGVVGPSTAPILQPLWFVRDLMVIVLLSPLIYGLLRYLKWGALLCWGTLYYLQLWPNYGGLTVEGFWYFSLGAWFSLNSCSPVRLAERFRSVALLLTLVLPLVRLLTPTDWQLFDSIVGYVYIFSAFLISIAVAASVTAQRRPSKLLAQSSFFVYAFHSILLFPLTTVAVRLAGRVGQPLQLLLYLACPLLALLLSLSAFAFVQRFLPRVGSCLTAIPIKK